MPFASADFETSPPAATALPPAFVIARHHRFRARFAGRVVYHHRRALRGQRFGDRCADPLRCPRYDRYFSRQLSHSRSPRFRARCPDALFHLAACFGSPRCRFDTSMTVEMRCGGGRKDSATWPRCEGKRFQRVTRGRISGDSNRRAARGSAENSSRTCRFSRTAPGPLFPAPSCGAKASPG